MKKRVFISHSSQEPGRDDGEYLLEKLIEKGYEVFFDQDPQYGIPIGSDWQQHLYQEVRKADVLILLIQKEAGDSEWVQREVDIARGANVQILPIKVSKQSDEDIKNTLTKLAIPFAQMLPLRHTNEVFNRICTLIEELAVKTRDDQEQQSQLLKTRRKSPKANDRQRAAVFKSNNPSSDCKIILAAGDMLCLKNVDVFVNPENDYMQMARVFEFNTISSRLRYEGAWKAENGLTIKEDTVQKELITRLEGMADGMCPLKGAKIIVTNAGHVESELHNSGAAAIFHVVSVLANPDDTDYYTKPVVPISGTVLKKAVRNCFKEINKINEAGSVWPEKTAHYQGKIAPIQSIVFPLLGTGTGGHSVEVVSTTMLKEIDTWLNDQPDTTLKNIYLCAYSEDDVKTVLESMKRIFQPA